MVQVDSTAYGTFPSSRARPLRRRYAVAILLSVAVVGLCGVTFIQREAASEEGSTDTESLYYTSHKSGCVRPADYWRSDLKQNKVVKIHCTGDCTNNHGNVHGENPFTLDSSPCIAAYRKGLLKKGSKGGTIQIKYAGLQTIYYRAPTVGMELLQYNHGYKKEAFVFVLQACKAEKAMPDRGPTKGGSYITIQGENFGVVDDSPEASVGGQPCNPTTWLNNHEVLCRVPAGSGRSLPIAVTVTGRTSHIKHGFSYLPPKIDRVVPASGPAVGQIITLLGANFGARKSERLYAKIGGKPCETLRWLNDSRLLCAVPPMATDDYDVSVSLDGNVGRLSDAFQLAGPTVASVQPSRWPATGKVTLTVHGSGFGMKDSKPIVQLGTQDCSRATWVSDKIVTCHMQSGHAAEVDVSVIVAGLTGSREGAFELLPPQIDSVSPHAYPATSGEKLLIQGASFGYHKVPVSVQLGDYQCADAQWESNERITCVVPAGLTGSVDVRVSVGQNSVSKVRAYTFLGPVVSRIMPHALPGTGAGREITIEGNNFGYEDKAPTVVVGHTACGNTRWLSNQQLRCALPDGLAGDVDVTVTIEGNSGRKVNGFHFGAPTIASFEPAHLPATGGDLLTIHGHNFGFSATPPQVTIGAAECSKPKWVSNHIVTCTTPAVVAGTMDVTVIVGENKGASHGLFEMRAPKVLSVIPKLGVAAGGQTITLVGTDFGWRDSSPVVHIGKLPCTASEWLSNTHITCQVAAGPSGKQDVSVQVGKNSATQGALLDLLPPMIKQVLPSNGAKLGGSLITIIGDNFGFVDASPEIKLGNEQCSEPRWVSNTELTCRSPAGPPKAVAVQVEVARNRATKPQGWMWNDCKNVTFTDDNSHTTWNSYCEPDMCNYRSGNDDIMSFKFKDVTFNTPLQEASLVFSMALDDHYSIPRTTYQLDATLNSQPLFNNQRLNGIEHGSPSNGAFKNFHDFVIPIDSSTLSSVRSVDTNKVELTLHAGTDNFVVIRRAALVVCS